MTPLQQQQQLGRRHSLSSIDTQKFQLIYKLLLLENARKTLEQEVNNFISKAYDDIQSFLNSSLPTSVFSDLAGGLDARCHTIDSVSALLKEFVPEPQVGVQPAVKMGMRINQLQPLKDKRILITDVLKFGPMLQNVLMASSIVKSVQVLGGTLSLQQLKHFLISQPAAAQENDMIYCISSSYNNTVQTKSSSCHLKVKEIEQTVIYEDKSQQDDVILQPAMNQSPKINPQRPQLLLPPIEAIFPELSNPKPKKVTPLISWGWEDNFQVEYQKQTSSQLLHFLRAKAKNMGALEVMEWNKSTYPSGLPQTTLSCVKKQTYEIRKVVSYDAIESQARKTLRADMEDYGPVFRVKRVESSGSLTYACVIATKTELWDIGDVLTEVQQANSDSPVKCEGCQNIAAQVENSSVNIQWETQTTKCTESESDNSYVDAETPKNSSITIPEFRVRRFEEIEVVVSHIVNPGNFYIQHADFFTRLQALVTDSWKSSHSYAEQNCIPDIGTQVMGWFPKQKQWCRVQVMKICGVIGDDNSSDGAGSETSINVEVKRLDHGDTACLSLLCIKELTPEMALLPLQAVQVSLANVTPANGRDWSEESVDWFKAMVHNRTLYARLYPQALRVTVELFLEKGKIGAMRRGASLSLRLAQNGHAKHSELKNGLSKNAVHHKMKKEDSDWGKYLVSCYTQNKREQ